MRSRFSRSSSAPATAKPQAKTRRKKRLRVAFGAFLIGTAPFLAWQIAVYRQNLAMSRVVLPPLPAFAPGDRLLVLSPHPDDETLGAGGTITQARRRGLPVRIVFLTSGDGSRSTQIAVNLRERRRHSFEELAALRRTEATSAAQKLGVDAKNLVFLGYPDGGTKQIWRNHQTPDNLYRSPFTGANSVPYAFARSPEAPYCGPQMLKDVVGALHDFQPTVVITTNDNDTHTDHQTACDLAHAALRQLRATPGETWAKNARLWTFVVHHGLWPVPYGYQPDAALAPPAALQNVGVSWQSAPLDQSARAAKKAALEAYPSQLATTPNYLRSFLRRNELFGVARPISKESR